MKEFREKMSHTGQSAKRDLLEDRRPEVSFVEYVELGQTEGRETNRWISGQDRVWKCVSQSSPEEHNQKDIWIQIEGN